MKNKYEQVADLIKDKIESRIYPPEDYLPGERVLAQELNVGRITVRSGLKILMRSRLIEAVNGKGYRVIGKQNRRRKIITRLIGTVFPAEKIPVSTAITSEGIAKALETRNYHMIYSSSEHALKAESLKIESLMDREVDGLIIMPVYRKLPEAEEFEENGNHEKFKELYDSGMPLVIVDRSLGKGGIPCVCNDDVTGGYMATKYLIGRGHKKIIFFGSLIDRISKLRYQGYCKAMEENDSEIRRYPMELSWNSISFGSIECIEKTRKMLSSITDETGIVTFGHFAQHISLLLTDFPHLKGRIEWTGYDIPPDPGIPGMIPYPWMKRPLYEIGKRAGEKILALINNEKDAGNEEFIKPELIEN